MDNGGFNNGQLEKKPLMCRSFKFFTKQHVDYFDQFSMLHTFASGLSRVKGKVLLKEPKFTEGHSYVDV